MDNKETFFLNILNDYHIFMSIDRPNTFSCYHYFGTYLMTIYENNMIYLASGWDEFMIKFKMNDEEFEKFIIEMIKKYFNIQTNEILFSLDNPEYDDMYYDLGFLIKRI